MCVCALADKEKAEMMLLEHEKPTDSLLCQHTHTHTHTHTHSHTHTHTVTYTHTHTHICHPARKVGDGGMGAMDAESGMEQNGDRTGEGTAYYPGDYYVDS